MSEPEAPLDLTSLQHRLDALSPGEILGIALVTYRHLFGPDDLAHDRALHFAIGHRCNLALVDGVVRFEKEPQRVEPAAAPTG